MSVLLNGFMWAGSISILLTWVVSLVYVHDEHEGLLEDSLENWDNGLAKVVRD